MLPARYDDDDDTYRWIYIQFEELRCRWRNGFDAENGIYLIHLELF